MEREGKLWTRMREGLCSVCRPHLSRIESHATSVGFPDVEGCIEGTEFWVELKSWDPKKGWHIRPSQIAWMRARLNAGGKRIFVFADKKVSTTHHHVLVPVAAGFLTDYGRFSSWDALTKNAIYWAQGPVDYNHVKELLCR